MNGDTSRPLDMNYGSSSAILKSIYGPEDLAQKGYYLFPCAGKTPLVKWSTRSTTDPETIQAWKAKYPGCNWGIDCGNSGLFVIDDDRGKNPEAVNSLLVLELEYGPLPETFTVRTKSDGYHYYYRGFGRNSAGNKLGPGLDTRGAGGFVVAPCSPGYSVVKDLPVADVPDWVIGLVGRPSPKKERTDPENVILDTPEDIARAASYLQSAEPAVEGNHGDDTTYKTACMVRDFGISEEKCFELMLNWNERCSPPWDPKDLEVKVANAYEYAENSLGALSPDTVFAEFIEPETEPRFKLLRSADIAKLPDLQWRVKGIITTRGLFQVYGVTTSGKSFLMLEMLAAIAEGRDWFGYKTKPTTVLYICLEGEYALKNRIAAWEKHHARQMPDNFLALAQPWSIIKKEDIIDLAKLVPKGSVIVIDTQNRAAPGINESASEDMGALLEGAKMLERLIEGAVGLVAHPGKDLSKGSRGHSSQIPTMDAVIEVTRDKKGEIRQWTAVKVKDGRDGQSDQFGLGIIELGIDEDGDPITSCAIDYDIIKCVDAKDVKLSPAVSHVWEAIKFAHSENGQAPVPEEMWQHQYALQVEKKSWDEMTPAERRRLQSRFYPHRKKLVNELKMVRETNIGCYEPAIFAPAEDGI